MRPRSADLAALLDKARSKLKTARIDFDAGQYDDAVSRAYYAVFHAMTAALLHKGFSLVNAVAALLKGGSEQG